MLNWYAPALYVIKAPLNPWKVYPIIILWLSIPRNRFYTQSISEQRSFALHFQNSGSLHYSFRNWQYKARSFLCYILWLIIQFKVYCLLLVLVYSTKKYIHLIITGFRIWKCISFLMQPRLGTIWSHDIMT